MKRVWITKWGGPEVLAVREAPDPEPGPGELRIRVAAAGVNFADILARMGLYPEAPRPPFVPGYEVSGEVDRVGSGAEGFRPGDRVVALTAFGGYADAVCVPAEAAFAIPPNLRFESAAALPVNYLTAWLMLVYLGNVRPGETVLVHAAAGGVGLAALQICRHRGAEVVGTASASKHERLLALGAKAAIDYRTQDFEVEVRRITGGRGVDIALDGVGGSSARKSYRSLAPLGRLFLFGVSSFAPGRRRSIWSLLRGVLAMPSFRPIRLMRENRGVFGVHLGRLWDRKDLLRQAACEIIDLAARGTFDPVIAKAFPLEAAPAAHAYIQERRNFGKVLLVPGRDTMPGT